jgi:hypothetical protein
MSNEQPAPLWPYGRMMESAYQRQRWDSTIDLATAYWRMAYEMRFDYEAERQRLTQANAQLTAEVERLKAEAREPVQHNWSDESQSLRKDFIAGIDTADYNGNDIEPSDPPRWQEWHDWLEKTRAVAAWNRSVTDNALDAPDAAGWWAWRSIVRQGVSEVYEGFGGELLVDEEPGGLAAAHFPGRKWYRLHMPWDAAYRE